MTILGRGRVLYFAIILAVGSRVSADVSLVTDASVGDYSHRYLESFKLGPRLSAVDVDELLQFLRRFPGEDKVSADQLAALKNNVVDALFRAEAFPQQLLPILLSDFHNAAQGEIWRGYIIQKMPNLARLADNERKRASAIKLLFDSAADTTPFFAGQALLALDRLSVVHPTWATPVDVKNAALNVLTSEKFGYEEKVSALPVLSHYDSDDARNLARSFLQGNVPTLLKSSSLATLGFVGGKTDRPTLEQFTHDPDVRLSKAAEVALNRLNLSGKLK